MSHRQADPRSPQTNRPLARGPRSERPGDACSARPPSPIDAQGPSAGPAPAHSPRAPVPGPARSEPTPRPGEPGEGAGGAARRPAAGNGRGPAASLAATPGAGRPVAAGARADRSALAWAALALLALLAGLPWMLATARLGLPPGAPVAVPAQTGLGIALEGDTAPAVYEEGGPPVAVGSTADARVFLRQFAPELARAGTTILAQRARREGWPARRVALTQLVLLRQGQVVARYDVWDGTVTRPAWIRYARLAGRWHPVEVVIGASGETLPRPR